MKLYSQLSKIGFLKNRYVAKFLFVAFLGIHIPLIGLVFFVVYFEHQLSPLNVFLIALVLTLFATFVTLLILKKLMMPVLLGSKALIAYRTNRTIPRLPLEYTDEAGVMLQNIQAAIQMNQKLLVEKKELFQLLTHDLKIQSEKTERLLTDVYNETEKSAVKDLASQAVKAIQKQLRSVDAFTEMMDEEVAINAEQVKVRKVNVAAVLNEVKTSFKSKLEAKNVGLKYNIHTPEALLKVNVKLLQKIFHYLFDIALKSAPVESEVQVTVEKVNGRLMLYVKDAGLGFESGQAEKIFTRFNSVSANEDEYAPGAGLYLTRQIVERFGGTIIAESAGLNEGVTFTIELKMYR